VNYSFGGKYFVTGTIRADGSSRFVNGVSVGWNLSNEDFLRNSGLNLLKLRAGWGQTGNNVIPNFTARRLFQGGANFEDEPGIVPSQLGNPDLKWETTSQTNIGLDFGFLSNRVGGSIDFFIKNTEIRVLISRLILQILKIQILLGIQQ